MKIVIVRGGTEGAVEAAKELLAAAHEGLRQEAEAAYTKAIATEERVEAVKERIARQIKELEAYRNKMVSELELAGRNHQAKVIELQGKAEEIAQVLEHLS